MEAAFVGLTGGHCGGLEGGGRVEESFGDGEGVGGGGFGVLVGVAPIGRGLLDDADTSVTRRLEFSLDGAGGGVGVGIGVGVGV